MRILVVEDEVNLADLIRECLEKEAYTVDVVWNGIEGYYKTQTEIYDIVVLDVMLPGMSGFDILKKLRAKKNGVSVLILTAKSEVDDKIYGLDLGADDYMTKPFEMKELLARIRVMARRNRKLEDDRICFHDLKLDPNQLSLYCTTSSQDIQLGSKEASLMEYLMVNANRILSKDQISNKIWGYETNVEYNNAEVYISFLRKKMTYLKSIAKIRTVRGVGYCLEAEEKGI